MVVIRRAPSGKGRPGTKRAREAVAREVKDLLLKRVAGVVPDTFLAALGLDLPRVVEILPTDLAVLEVRGARPDMLLRLADGSLVHIEFQTTVDPGDLRRFYRYHFAISEQHDCVVHTIVLYGPGITAAPSDLDRGSARYQVKNVYLGQRDGEALVARLRERAAAGELWSAQERVEAILLPLMGRERPLPVLLAEVAEASAVLPAAERRDMLGSMVGLAYNYLEPGLAEQLLEVLRKMNAFEELLADYIIKGRDQGIAEGRAEGRAEGHAEGHAEGRAEGRVEGERAAVVRILERRFGAMPGALAEELAAMQDPDRLAVLLDAALEAESLDGFAQALRGVGTRP